MTKRERLIVAGLFVAVFLLIGGILVSKALAQAFTSGVVPTPGMSVPNTELIGGSSGSRMNSFAMADQQHPRITRAVVVQTDGAGNWTASWQALSAVPIVDVTPISTANQPVICNVTGRTTTGATGRCFIGQTTLLNLSIITSGLTLNGFGTPAAATDIQVLAIPPAS